MILMSIDVNYSYQGFQFELAVLEALGLANPLSTASGAESAPMTPTLPPKFKVWTAGSPALSPPI